MKPQAQSFVLPPEEEEEQSWEAIYILMMPNGDEVKFMTAWEKEADAKQWSIDMLRLTDRAVVTLTLADV